MLYNAHHWTVKTILVAERQMCTHNLHSEVKQQAVNTFLGLQGLPRIIWIKRMIHRDPLSLITNGKSTTIFHHTIYHINQSKQISINQVYSFTITRYTYRKLVCKSSQTTNSLNSRQKVPLIQVVETYTDIRKL